MKSRAVSTARKVVGGVVVAAGLSSALFLTNPPPVAHAEDAGPPEAKGPIFFRFDLQDDCINAMKDFVNNGWTVDPNNRCFFDGGTPPYPLQVFPPP